MAVLLLVASPAVFALGLGQARVHSYLQQPLDMRIDLISRSEAELATVTAGMASAADFRVMGLSSAAVGMPLEFIVERDLEDPHIRVRGSEPITEPVLQIVIEVVWASGRMVRQYTVFIDPPTFDSAAPLPSVSGPSDPSAPAVSDDPAREMPAPVTDSGPPFDPGTEAPAEPLADDVPPPVEDAPAVRTAMPDPDTAPPGEHLVSRGETLWGLSRRWADAHGVDINQMMLAVQQRNPDAFNRGNINSLKAGAVLRLPDDPAEFTYDAREAMLEVLRQEQIYRDRWNIPSDPNDLPTVAELAQQPDRDAGSGPAPAEAEDDGRLELVPPSEGVDESEEVLARGNAGDAGAAEGESVVEELARAEEDLANARQENEYLNDRIRELEAELERSRAAVEDSNLAEMEDRLREQRATADEDETGVPADPPDDGYGRYLWWFIGALVLLVGGLVWWLRSRSAGVGDLDESAEH